MLPGFRFLVAAIVFSFSVIVFGLGAAALFRAAHEQFASSSSWRATPETSFTTFLPQVEPPRPMIAMLRVEPAMPMPVSASSAAVDVQTELSSTDAPAAAESSLPAQPAPPEQATRTDIVDVQGATAEATQAAPPNAPMEIAETPTPASPQPDTANLPAAAIASADAAPATTGIAVTKPDSPPVITAAHTTIEASIGTDTAAIADAAVAIPPATNAAPRPDPIASKLASLGEQPTVSQRSASLKTATLQLRRSLARKKLAKERLAKERIAEARRAKRQREMAAQRAYAARNAAAALQQQQYANPFAQPQGFEQSAFGQQTAQRTR